MVDADIAVVATCSHVLIIVANVQAEYLGVDVAEEVHHANPASSGLPDVHLSRLNVFLHHCVLLLLYQFA